MSHSYPKHTAANHAAGQRRVNAAELARDDARKKAIKALKTKQGQLGMDDATYRAMLLGRTGKTSAKELNLTELGLVNNYLTACRAVNPKGLNGDGRKRLATPPDKQALMGKVKAQLAELARITGTPYTLAYADAICANNGWCTRVDWGNAKILHDLVGALARTVAAKTKAAHVAACKS